MRLNPWQGALAVLFAISRTVAATDLYVNDTAAGVNDGTSWPNAFVDVQSALSVAAPGDTVHVAEGTYLPSVEVGGTGERYRAFQLKNGVTLLGGYPDGGGPRDPAAHISVCSGDIGTPGSVSDNRNPRLPDWDSYSVCLGVNFRTTGLLVGQSSRCSLNGS